MVCEGVRTSTPVNDRFDGLRTLDCAGIGNAGGSSLRQAGQNLLSSVVYKGVHPSTLVANDRFGGLCQESESLGGTRSISLTLCLAFC